MTREEMMKQLKKIRDKVTVCSLESTFEDDRNSIAMNMVIELLEQESFKYCPNCGRQMEMGEVE